MDIPKKTIRLIIADDHPIVRMGIRLLLETGEGIELVGEAVDGREAIELVEKVQPDVLLLDVRMPEMDGLTALKQIRESWPQIAVIMLTTYNEDDLMIRCLRAGARGYLLKDADIQTILHTIHAAARGELLMQLDIMERLLSHTSDPTPPSVRRQRSLNLTAREQDILKAVAQGERSKEIAAHLGITERTVGATLTTIYTKLGVDSRAAAVAVALEQGLIPSESSK